MKERPILMSAPMVRALLDGTKTQTRRAVKLPVEYDAAWCGGWKIVHKLVTQTVEMFNRLHGAPLGTNVAICPYGQPGDRLWIREAFALSVVDPDGGPPDDDPENYDVIYRATDTPGGEWTDGEGNTIAAPWKPSIHMPRWASRILLEITSVRVERLQDISEADAVAEGIAACDGLGTVEAILDLAKRMGDCTEPVLTYATLWESINGVGSWNKNPFCWVIEFKRVAP
ncbi:hypothetical protein HH212_26360 [Massilia forsythiae]|uniref:Morphogenetic protein n=1 Tax=Massilia forsythiae TaxID=2728020 RepID=A0A7Z2W1J0_9BURK|nr:hypothetical protein [Massilia forsythiae]QJE03078.1 hypothetical protein HH212_26360 [Massilia forsythiae]